MLENKIAHRPVKRTVGKRQAVTVAQDQIRVIRPGTRPRVAIPVDSDETDTWIIGISDASSATTEIKQSSPMLYFAQGQHGH